MNDFVKRIEQSRKLDAIIKAKMDAFAEEMRPYRDVKEKLRAAMLDMLNKSGQDSAKTEAGTVYRTTKVSCSLEDPELFRRHVIGTESWELADWKANSTACVDFVEANSHLPPGVKMTTMQDVGVRAPVARKSTAADRAGRALQQVENQTQEQPQDEDQEAQAA